MSRRSPEAIYLEDVLGIEGFVRPTYTVVVVLSDVPLVNGRLELLKKMMTSIEVHNFVALDCTRDEQAKLAGVQASAVIFLGPSAPQLVREWPQNARFSEVVQAHLPSLAELTDTSDMSRLQNIKREAWARLQSFQKEI